MLLRLMLLNIASRCLSRNLNLVIPLRVGYFLLLVAWNWQDNIGELHFSDSYLVKMNPVSPTSTSRLWLVGFKTKRTRRKSGYIKTRRGAAEEQQLYISLLSQDMIMEILSRLPIHALFQCTLVCKAWRDIIIHNPIFLSMQHNRALENQNDTLSLMLCLGNPKGTHLYLVERGGVGHCKFTMIDAQLTGLKANFRTGLNGRFEIVGSCNGLLCITFSKIYPQLVYISNPITGECLMLPPRESTRLLGFGFHSARNEYKVLRVVCEKGVGISSWKVEIQTLGTNAWRQIDDVPLSYMTCLCWPKVQFSNILVNGSLHWCRDGRIVSLDMGDERFGEVTTPDSFNEHSPYHVMNLMVWKGYLTVVERLVGVGRPTQAWVMKEYNVKESWTKQVNNVKWPSWFAHGSNYWPLDESFIDDLQSIKHPRFSFRADSSVEFEIKFKVMPHVGSLLSLKTVAGEEGVQNIKFLPGVSVEEDARNI